jgi:hypothetical protein
MKVSEIETMKIKVSFSCTNAQLISEGITLLSEVCIHTLLKYITRVVEN